MTGVGTAKQELKLAQAIADARHKAGMTQQELCAKAGLSYSTLAKIERGAIKTPSVFTVATIAEATGTTVEMLTGQRSFRQPEPDTPKKDYKTSKTGIKFVYFDVNGVLIRYFQRTFTSIAADTGTSADAVEAIFWHYNDTICRGEMSLEEFDFILAKRVGVEKISWAEYYLKNVDPIQGSHEIVEWAAEHYGIGLMTNIMPGLIKMMAEKDILPKVNYEVIIDSSEVGIIKPERAIYEQAVQLANVKPTEILLVDDSRTNLMAAERLGWHVLWFDDYHPDEGAERIRQALEF
jgi:FMN phosphatase YigB (HAD superfamily)/lambda repressor-like predicted transcriptional regulator